MRDADLALYQAKATGRDGYAVYDGSMHEQVLRRHSLADALRGALDAGEIKVVFQPIRGGAGYQELMGWEALARWDSPAFGPVSPVEFIPIAEDTGLIIEIGAFVLHVAAAQLACWQQSFSRPDLHVSVNVSSVQVLRGGVVQLTSSVLAASGLSAQSLWLEITESVVLDRTDEAITTLNELGALGVKLCMDDFGTGYSSLSYLKDFPVHILKVDRAFVRNIVEDQRDRELTKMMIAVANALGLEGVVAEGVETLEQAAVLSELGCQLIQGYLYGKPMPPTEAAADLAELMGLRPPPSVSALPQPRQPDGAILSDQGSSGVS